MSLSEDTSKSLPNTSSWKKAIVPEESLKGKVIDFLKDCSLGNSVQFGIGSTLAKFNTGRGWSHLVPYGPDAGRAELYELPRQETDCKVYNPPPFFGVDMERLGNSLDQGLWWVQLKH